VLRSFAQALFGLRYYACGARATVLLSRVTHREQCYFVRVLWSSSSESCTLTSNLGGFTILRSTLWTRAIGKCPEERSVRVCNVLFETSHSTDDDDIRSAGRFKATCDNVGSSFNSKKVVINSRRSV